MAYTALEKMRKLNESKYNCDIGPVQPEMYINEKDDNDLESCVARFIHERCEDLNFNREIEAEEDKTGVYQGTSFLPGQIPYNMQMDINRLCFEREMVRFLMSGSTQDAYDIYYCYLEMFMGSYSKTKQMVELLSEYEANGSSLLIKHRDHYSHSVYVFALGLAIYESNENYRRTFNSFYHFDRAEEDPEESHAAAAFFLQYWGLTALFHDIGYPFELPFNQVNSYFAVSDKGDVHDEPFLAYKHINVMTDLGEQAKKRFEEIYGRKFDSTDELLAYDIAEKLGETYGFSEEYLLGILKNTATAPEKCDYVMDHGYFSALRLYQGLTESMGIDSDVKNRTVSKTLERAHVDALSAIMLHNVLFKYHISFYKTGEKPPLDPGLHPLAWLLMLCDELQCWDRAAYGRNSRTQLQPMGADFDFSNGRMVVSYLFDEDEQEKIDDYLERYVEWKTSGKQSKEPVLKAYSDIANSDRTFTRKIEKLVDTSMSKLIVLCNIAPVNRGNKQLYISNSNFLHLHEFAVALNARAAHEGNEKEVDQETLEEEFSKMSLEYQLSSINLAKSFGRYLNAVHCFYTDRSVDYDVLTEFTEEQLDVFAPMEYERWIYEREAMGWIPDDLYERIPVPEGADKYTFSRKIREQMRCHKHLLPTEGLTSEDIYRHYDELTDRDKVRDRRPFNSMLQLIKKYDGLRIYSFSSES